MECYDFTELKFDNSGIVLESTDVAELEKIKVEVKKIFPNVNISYGRYLPSGELCYYTITQLSNKEFETGWWIIKHLCSSGWEPLGVASLNTSTTFHHQFKRKSTR